MKFFSLALAGLVGLALVGCGNNPGDDGLSAKDKEAVSRIDQIAKQSGGDWSKVSQADKDYLIKEVAQGSEQSAKMLLMGKAGKFGGPPAGGRPGGPPNGGR